jgi:hypothetical protein
MQWTAVQKLDLLVRSVPPARGYQLFAIQKQTAETKTMMNMDWGEIYIGCINLLVTFSELYNDCPNRGPKVAVQQETNRDDGNSADQHGCPILWLAKRRIYGIFHCSFRNLRNRKSNGLHGSD